MAGNKSNKRNVIPGFGLSLGYTVFYLSVIVLIPLSMLFFKGFSMSWPKFWETISNVRTLSAFRISMASAVFAAALNAGFGTLLAWVLVRYDFFGKRVINALIDLPFALPTAVAGITLTTLYAPNGWIGKQLVALGIQAAYSPLGIVIALTFIGLPFVVRTVEPVLENLDPDIEEAAASLGASRFQTVLRVVFPHLLPAILTGFVMAFARGLGEYGSLVFISGNMPGKTEVISLLIMAKLEQFDYEGAAAIGILMLAVSFVMLFILNGIQWISRKRFGMES